MPAAPYSPDFRPWTRDTTIRDPELPIAWPSATAPLPNDVNKGDKQSHKTHPSTLTFAGSICRSFSATRATTEKASLTSNRAISSMVKFALFSASGSATVGAIGKSMGSTPASAYAEEMTCQTMCVRLSLVELTNYPGEGFEAELRRFLCRHQYQSRGTIVEV